MNIDEMSEHEKSIALAELCGWEVTEEDTRAGKRFWIKSPDYRHATTNLYKPEFMFLTWAVLNWAVINLGVSSNTTGIAWTTNFHEWVLSHMAGLALKPPLEAQAMWLDKILELAIETELVQDANT